MTKYGYARVSSLDQNLEVQISQLKEAGCTIIRQEKKSGTNRDKREQLKVLLEFIQQGDTLVITRMDRLARSALDLLQIVAELDAKGVHLQILKQNIDTSTTHGRFFLTVLAGIAEFDTTLRKERQAEGVAKAKAAGKYKGRKPQIDRKPVFELLGAGVPMPQIARTLKISLKSVKRIKLEWEGSINETA